MILRTDAARGSFKAPAGAGATLSGAVGTSRRLNNSELDTLNSLHVNAIRPVPGSGISVMGARTRDFNTTAKYISVRRTLNYIKERAKQASSFALFEPNTPSLWEQLRVANGAFLSELWQVGGLAGQTFAEGFYVKVDSDNNPPPSIAAGEVHIEIGVAPVFPSEFVIIRIGQFESDPSFTVTEE
jgi:phage tail sheath protein FI